MGRKDDTLREALSAAAAELATAASQGRVPPHDLEAERAVLAACLLDAGLVPKILAVLRPDRFYHPSHALIFESIEAVYARTEPIDVLTLSAELRARNRLNSVGGAQYLGEITDFLPSLAHWEAHVAIVLNHARRRELLAHGVYLQQSAMELSSDPSGIALETIKKMIDIQSQIGTGNYRSMQEVTMEGYREIEAHYDGKEGTEVGYGFYELDRKTAGGAHNSQIIVVAGRPAMGKSAFAQCVAMNMVRREVITAKYAQRMPRSVLFVSQEMKGRDLGIRQLCADTGVDQTLARMGEVSDVEMDKMLKIANGMEGMPLFVVDHGNARVPEIRATALTLKARYGLLAVFVDYLQIVNATRRYDNRTDAVGEVSRDLKQLAMELDVPLMELSQLNRECEKRPDKRPWLADLRSSGEIEQDADVVLAVFRPEHYAANVKDYAVDEWKGKAEIILLKQRNGPCETILVGFRKETTKFFDLTSADGSKEKDAKYVPGMDEQGPMPQEPEEEEEVQRTQTDDWRDQF